MLHTSAIHTLHSYAEELAVRAQTREGVPTRIAEHARDVTCRSLAHLGTVDLEASERRRVRAYYRGVMRREAARSRTPGAREYRIKAMAASVAADLKASGADRARIDREVAAWLASYPGAA
ncbi:MAG: hypothetical protein RBS78_04325 [Coriobacteriia bacterium]|jgi:hypothetical protein|nr:hypothetical protein [Coriobacteriia bacterium]